MSSRWDDEFARERHDGTLHRHQQCDERIAIFGQPAQVPVKQAFEHELLVRRPTYTGYSAKKSKIPLECREPNIPLCQTMVTCKCRYFTHFCKSKGLTKKGES